MKRQNLGAYKMKVRLPKIMAGKFAKKNSVYTDPKGHTAVVPKGWTVSAAKTERTIWDGLVIYRLPRKIVKKIDWSDSYTVERLRRKFDQFVYVPVYLLLDGDTILNKVRGRNYLDWEISKFLRFFDQPKVDEWVEEIVEQHKSVVKYGGFYVSRYHVSRDIMTGAPRAIKGWYPWRERSVLVIKKIAETMIQEDSLKTHLTFGQEFDTRLEWLIESGNIEKKYVAENSSSLGNYNSRHHKCFETGCYTNTCHGNIYDVTGNVREATQEKYRVDSRYEETHYVLRGGSFLDDGQEKPLAFRQPEEATNQALDIGFRVTLWIQ